MSDEGTCAAFCMYTIACKVSGSRHLLYCESGHVPHCPGVKHITYFHNKCNLKVAFTNRHM